MSEIFRAHDESAWAPGALRCAEAHRVHHDEGLWICLRFGPYHDPLWIGPGNSPDDIAAAINAALGKDYAPWRQLEAEPVSEAV